MTPRQIKFFRNGFSRFFEIIESESMSFYKALKLSIKRSFCPHRYGKAEYIENPSPLLFLDVKAKCSDCGACTYEINKKAHDSYKLQLAEEVLYQRNRDKFPEFYKAAYTQQEMKSRICHICDKERPAEKISVHIAQIKDKDITFALNVRYCNDSLACIARAQEFSFLKDMEARN